MTPMTIYHIIAFSGIFWEKSSTFGVLLGRLGCIKSYATFGIFFILNKRVCIDSIYLAYD